jgi:phage terminase large subunit
MNVGEWTGLLKVLAWPVTVFLSLLFLRNAVAGAISRLKGVEGPAGWKLFFEVKKVGDRLQRLEALTVDIYNLSGESSAVRDEIFEYVANILDKVSPHTALEMRTELNKYHIPRIGVSVAELKEMLSKLKYYQRSESEKNIFNDDITSEFIEATYSYQKAKKMRDADGVIGPKTIKLLTADVQLLNNANTGPTGGIA